MTIHSYGEWYSNYSCKNCQESFIPYGAQSSCPRCGELVKRNSEFAKLAAASLIFNLNELNSYLPEYWAGDSFSDKVLLLLFEVFENYREEVGISSKPYFEKYVDEIIEKTNRPLIVKKEYLKGLSSTVYDEIQKALK